MDSKKLAATVLCVDPTKDLVLAVSRKDNPIAMGLPGGKLDAGESYKQAAAREFTEETGYGVDPKDLIYVYGTGKDDTGYCVATFLLPFKFWNPIKQETLAVHETGVVRWVPWQTLFDGPYGSYNKALYLEVSDKLQKLNGIGGEQDE
jgi:8-oxo-dGTP pyrophosphatase MutT (NUDIX family)